MRVRIVWMGLLITTGCAAPHAQPTQPLAPPDTTPAAGFVEIALGDTHLCARTRDGQVACQGSHHAGQLGLASLPMRTDHGDATRLETPRIVPLTGSALALVAAAHHTCAVSAGRTGQRRAVCWGEGAARPFDLGHDDVAALATGRDHVCALTDDGQVHCHTWSPTRTDAPDTPLTLTARPPLDPGAPADVLVADGTSTCVGAREGWLTCWSVDGEPLAVPEVEPFTHVDLGGSRLCTLGDDALRCWSLADLDPIGYAPRVLTPSVEALDGTDARRLVVARDRCVVRTSGVVECLARPVSGLHPDPYAIPDEILARPDLVDLDARLGWGCAITREGQARCWADDERAWRFGELRATRVTHDLLQSCPPGQTPTLTAAERVCRDAAGRRQGPGRLYQTDTGRLHAEGTWRDDLREGPWLELAADGGRRHEGRYVAGLRDGLWTTTRVDRLTGLEQLAVEGTWASGVQVGTWRWPYEDRAMILDDAGAPVSWQWGAWQLRRDDAGTWWREQLDDDRRVVARAGVTAPTRPQVWTPDDAGVPMPGGEVFDGVYEGRRDGVVVHGAFADGTPHGDWSAVDDDGQTRWSGTFEAGRPVGAWRAWHADGAPALSGELSAPGVPDGRWRRWHDHGQLAVDGRYDAGLMVGRWRWFDRSGARVLERDLGERTLELAFGILLRVDARTGAEIDPMFGISSATTTSGAGATLVEQVAALVDVEPWLNAPAAQIVAPVPFDENDLGVTIDPNRGLSQRSAPAPTHDEAEQSGGRQPPGQ